MRQYNRIAGQWRQSHTEIHTPSDTPSHTHTDREIHTIRHTDTDTHTNSDTHTHTHKYIGTWDRVVVISVVAGIPSSIFRHRFVLINGDNFTPATTWVCSLCSYQLSKLVGVLFYLCVCAGVCLPVWMLVCVWRDGRLICIICKLFMDLSAAHPNKKSYYNKTSFFNEPVASVLWSLLQLYQLSLVKYGNIFVAVTSTS